MLDQLTTLDPQVIEQERRETIIPLGRVGMFLFPLLHRLAHPARRTHLEQRYMARRQVLEARRINAQVKKQVQREAAWFAQILITAWERQGYYHRFRNEGDGPTTGKKGQKQRIKFVSIIGGANAIYYKVKTRKRGLFTYRSALPYGTRVIDLVSEETIEELCRACDRKVTVAPYPFHDGVWIIVYRLQGMDGIPAQVPFSHVVRQLPERLDKAPIILGVGEHRHLQSIYLDEYPHGVVGGGAGSGKSNIINSMICQLLRSQTPATMRFILIDLKMGMEFNFYKQSSHLFRPVVTDEREVVEVLDEMLHEMQRRMKLMSAAGVKKLDDWNRRFPDQRLPRIVIIVDEWAEIALSKTRGVADGCETLATRIVNLGRASGIHLIICTQRPATDILPNRIRINMPFVVAGRVQSEAQSRVILSKGRADELPKIPGRMIAETGQDAITFQSPFISDDEVAWSVAYGNGVASGLIKLVDQQPALQDDKLTTWLLDRTGGLVSKEIGQSLQSLGIHHRMWRNYVDGLIHDGKIEQRSGTNYLKAAPPTPEQPLETPVLAIPPPVQEATPTIDSPAPDVQTPAAPPGWISDRETVVRFLTACCEFDPRYKTRAVDLWNAYTLFCDDNGITDRLNKVSMPRTLRTLHPQLINKMARVDGESKRIWVGIRLSAQMTIVADVSVVTDVLDIQETIEEIAA